MNFSDVLIEGNGSPVLMLAHGAGAPADSGFMNLLSAALIQQGVSVARFEFPYMQRRRQDGRKRPSGSAPGLVEFYRERVSAVREVIGPGRTMFIGGKSMGGRVASLLAAEDGPAGKVEGAVCFGYPFHPPAKPTTWRTDHFPQLQYPLCIIQGTRDPFGKPGELSSQPGLGSMAQVHWLEGGDHDFMPLKRQPEAQADLMDRAASIAAAFMRQV